MAKIEIIRGDDANLRFTFTDPTILARVKRAVFTAVERGGTTIQTKGVIDGSDIIITLTNTQTSVVGAYRADLEFRMDDDTIRTVWLATNYGDITIIDDVTKRRILPGEEGEIVG